MNLYILLAMIAFPVANPTNDIEKNTENTTTVTSNFIQGNWRIVEINNNGNRIFSRDTYHFFNDNTGYQGRNQRIDWKIYGNHLILTTYNNGQINAVKWNIRKDYKNYLILTRFETEEVRGKTVTKIIKIKLLKQ